MKKHLLMVLVAMLAVAQNAFAYDFSIVVSSGQRLYFNIIGENEVEVTSQNTSSPYYSTAPTGDMVIPNSVTNGGNTYTVTRIGDYAFISCTDLTSVTIANSVVRIGSHAFMLCEGLTSVSIPNSVTSIGNWAFANCEGLISVVIPNSVISIEEEVFNRCSSLTNVTIGNSVTSIGGGSFTACFALNAVYYTGTIAQWCGIYYYNSYGVGADHANPLFIAHNLYIGGTLLTNLVIPEEVTEVKPYSFIGCTSLTSVVVLNSETRIGNNAFDGCTELTSIECLSSTPPLVGSGAFNNVPNDIPVMVPCGSVSDYQSAAYWEYFTNIQDNCGTPSLTYFTVRVTSNNNTWGIAYGDGSVANGHTATLNAIPNTGFQFVRWNDSNTENPRTITVTSDTNFVGYFEPIGVIHDTVYVIAPERGTPRITVYAEGDAIVAEGADGNTVTLYDANGNDLTTECAIAGTPVRFESLTSGTYYVKIGILPSRLRVVVR